MTFLCIKVLLKKNETNFDVFLLILAALFIKAWLYKRKVDAIYFKNKSIEYKEILRRQQKAKANQLLAGTQCFSCCLLDRLYWKFQLVNFYWQYKENDKS